MTLPEFWFLLIGFMFASYFMLEGFDFGVGALLPVLGKDDIGRHPIPVPDLVQHIETGKPAGSIICALMPRQATFSPLMAGTR